MRSRRAARLIAAAALLLPVASRPQPPASLELRTQRDFTGTIQRVATDPSGERAFLATPSALYEVRDGKPRLVDAGPGGGAQLVLAPGGGIHAWMIPDDAPRGLFTVQLSSAPSRRLAKLRLDRAPFGFGALYLGPGGRLVVTATPLDDWQGLTGRFLWTFWTSAGKQLGTVTLDGRRTGVVDPLGAAILLLGESEAIAFAPDGKRLWQQQGSYRKAALAGGAGVALLNPAAHEALAEVHVSRHGKASVARIATPVHELALSPDGALGVAVGDQGRYFFVPTDGGEVREAARLPIEGTYYITAARFLDARTLVLGVGQRAPRTRRGGFTRGEVLVVALDGKVLARSPIRIEDSTFAPSVDVTPGSRSFAAFTPQSTLLLSVGGR